MKKKVFFVVFFIGMMTAALALHEIGHVIDLSLRQEAESFGQICFLGYDHGRFAWVEYAGISGRRYFGEEAIASIPMFLFFLLMWIEIMRSR